MSTETSSNTGSPQDHEEGHHQEDLSSLTLPVINFVVFLGVLTWVFKKKVQPMMVLRAKSFNATVAKVEEAERKFQEEVQSLRYQLARIDEEEKQVIEAFTKQGRLSAEIITKQGLDEIAGLQAETAQTKTNLVNQLEEEVRGTISEKAMKLASDKLSQALTPEMDRNLRTKVLQSI